MSKQDIIGNLTTIIKILIMTIAPAIAVYLGTDEQTVIAFLTAVLTFILAVYDARYPNNLGVFGNQTITDNEPEILNDEYTSPEYEEEEDEY
jgi:uncharacterized membrane protein YqaE (UPF0057 family)